MGQAAEELHRRSGAREHLGHFCTYTMPTYEEAAHLDKLDEALERVERGELKRLMVFMPPRHGKSEKTSIRFPAWALGKNPERSIVQASYAEGLALKHSRAARDVVTTEEFELLFPDVHHRPERRTQERLPPPMQQAHEWGTKQGGSYYAVGVCGGLTGRGYDIGIIDDPIKDDIEAESLTYRERVWQWYTKVFRTRAEPGAAIILIMTRWHEDDLAGRLLKQQKEDPLADQWEILHLPALDEQERALWPARYDTPELLKTKASIGPYAFAAEYQGTPSPEKGNIFLKEWWKWYDELPAMLDEMAQTWDMTFKEAGTSMVVGQVWGRKGADKYLIDEVRGKMDFPATLESFEEFTRYWPQAIAKLVEDKANGPAIIASLKNKIAGIIAVNPRGGKVARARAASPEVHAGNVWLPKDQPWAVDFVDECATFPHGAFDDRVDAFTQMLAAWQGLIEEEAETGEVVEHIEDGRISAV